MKNPTVHVTKRNVSGNKLRSETTSGTVGGFEVLTAITKCAVVVVSPAVRFLGSINTTGVVGTQRNFLNHHPRWYNPWYRSDWELADKGVIRGCEQTRSEPPAVGSASDRETAGAF